MGHRVTIEVLQADGRTLEVTPAGGLRTTAPVLPRGEVLEFGGGEYIVLAVRQSLMGWPGVDDWKAVTTYLVDEAVSEGPAPAGPLDGVLSSLLERSWSPHAGEAA